MNPTRPRRIHALAGIAAVCGLAVSCGVATAQCFLHSIPASPTTSFSTPQVFYDSARVRLLILDTPQGSPAKMYAWTGSSWSLLSNSGPISRFGSAAAYDQARDRLVVYGGFINGAPPTYPEDVWEWNGTAWSVITPLVPVSGRFYHAMTYDAAIQRVVMFGGAYQGTLPDDLLAWDGANWEILPATQRPPGRRQSSLAYDSARQRVVLFSGIGGGNTILGDLWEWDGAGWSPRPAGPSTRLAQITFDPTRSRMLVLGGSNPPQSFTDAWEFDGAAGTWAQRIDLGPTFHTGLGVYVPTLQRIAFASGTALWVWDGNGSVVAPWITGQPVGSTVPPGDTMSMSVGAAGGPSSYQWQKDGVSLFNSGSISGADSAILRISPLAPTDSGSYRVVVSNACGLVTSQAASLSVTTECGSPVCYANCDGSTLCPLLSANDFQCFLNRFAAGASYANCDGSTNLPVFTANDYQCYLNAFAAGCS